MSTKTNSTFPHPYYPRGVSIPHYVPNETHMAELLGVFFGLVAIVIAITWIVGTRKRFGKKDRLILCWLVCCGFIHSVLEGYFSAFHDTLAGGSSYLAQMWKEYGKADSRYITSDTFTVCMESITALVDGPLCFATAYAYVTKSQYRYVLQLIVSLCQLYGDSLYFLTEIKENFIHGEMWHPLHFWFYFVFLNLWWIAVPLLLIGQAAFKLANAQAAVDTKITTSNIKKKRH